MSRSNGSHTGPPNVHLVTERDHFDPDREPTNPDADVVVSNAVLYRLLRRLSSRITWLAAGIVMMAGSLILMGLLVWWTRPR